VSSHDPLIDLRGVGARMGATTILRDVNVSVSPGEAVGLFGANGAGKTTLLRIMATLLMPSEGEGTVLGAAVTGPDRYDVRPQISLIGHVPALYPELTLRENLRFVAQVGGESDQRVDEVLATVGLADAADRRAAACSYGMQRRAEFARELMRAPDLLLLDEPHTALDAAAVELVGHITAGVTARGGAAVVVSHDRARVASMVVRSMEVAGGTIR
jgi:heme ABC exporter ATP-binding subunit CcmA